MSKAQKNPDCSEVISKEKAALKKRRELLFGAQAAEEFDHTSFGLALSGGGIRSATINLGFMKTLNRFGLLQRADYLSTVSGGGYAGAYIHGTLKGLVSEADPKRTMHVNDYYGQLFSEKHIDHLRSRGEYLIPGKGSIKTFNRLVLVIGYLSSLIMSLLSPALMIAIVYSIWGMGSVFVGMDQDMFWKYATMVLTSSAMAFAGILVVHYILNRVEIYDLRISLWFHRIETGFFLAVVITILATAVPALGLKDAVQPERDLMWYLTLGVGALALGFFVNPNASSFHRFYRGQLSEAFLKFAGTRRRQNILLKDFFVPKEDTGPTDNLNPYPLINTCLNLQAIKDPKFQGTKTNDYFLLSPLYCGAKLTGYVETNVHAGYSSMTLPAATTISAAALNPGMGIYSNKILSVFLSIFNARLGYWTWNPMKSRTHTPAVWWPLYFFYELLSAIGTDKRMLNISDGGHIENLAVYELLRRKCRLIIAVDAGEDLMYTFSDLENLTIRSRNELGIEIRFLEGHDPEDTIRPKASFGYSRKRFAVAGLYKIWEEFALDSGEEVLVNYIPYARPGEAHFEVFIKNDNNPAPALLEKAKQATAERYYRENPDKTGPEKLRVGTLVYVKSSVTAPIGKPNIAPPKEVKQPDIFTRMAGLFKKTVPAEAPKTTQSDLNYAVYKYKIYHPAFPHEPTSDQFFDEVQWEAYYQLGQHIGDDMLEGFAAAGQHADDVLKGLIAHFESPAEATAGAEAAVTSDAPSERGLEEELPKAAEQVEPSALQAPQQEDYYKI